MKRKIYIKPPPPARSILVFQVILGGLFLLLGPVILFIAEGEARIFAGFFSVIWTVVCIGIIVNALRMLKFIKKEKIEVAEIGGGSAETECAFSSKLRDLEGLKKDGLISDDEYRKKRGEIMDEKW
jgi:hypothetical protein